MPPDPFAMLFGGVLALALLLAILEWLSHRRRIAFAAIALAALAVALLAFELASVKTSIRVDLLLTVPLIALAAAVVGVLAILAPPRAARAVGALLAAVGAITLGWCAWSLAVSTARLNRIGLAFDEGRKLYWQETIRCQANSEKRFGPLQRRDSPCLGNLAVSSRSGGAYPYTRIVVSDGGQFDLLISWPANTEDTIRLIEGPFGPLKPRPDGSLYVESDPSKRQPAVELRPASNGGCEARIGNDYLKSVGTYRLRRIELGACPASIDPPVHFLGAWGSLVADPPGSAYLRLTQIWFWESQGRGYALIDADNTRTNVHRFFNFPRRYTGTRDAQGAWHLRSVDEDNPGQTISVTVAGELMRLSGAPGLPRSSREVTLHPAEVITHPKIALVPVRDAALFERYFNTVLFNLNIPWTPQQALAQTEDARPAQ
jgi:hypothetical protein